MLFGGPEFYPCGGMNDFITDGNDLEFIKATMDSLYIVSGYKDWYHIYDTEKQEIILDSTWGYG